MARLYRPPIPLDVKLRVVLRQLGYSSGVVNEAVRSARKARTLGAMLARYLVKLAEQRHCYVEELRLDHDPPLGARPRRRHGLGRKTYYTPDANDPDHLFYRPHGPEHEGSHLVKTNIRGDRGQHPDRVLIKKARKLERSRNREIPASSSGFPKKASRVKLSARFVRILNAGSERRNAMGYGAPAPASPYNFSVNKSVPKRKWPKRSFDRRAK